MRVSLATLVRNETGRLLRPGQARTSVVTHRLARGDALGSGSAAALRHYDVEQGSELAYAVYGRGRYGAERYAHVVWR